MNIGFIIVILFIAVMILIVLSMITSVATGKKSDLISQKLKQVPMVDLTPGVEMKYPGTISEQDIGGVNSPNPENVEHYPVPEEEMPETDVPLMWVPRVQLVKD